MHANARSDSRWTTDAVFVGLLACSVLGFSCFLLAQGPALSPQDFRIFYTAPQMLLHCPSHLYDITAQRHWQQKAAGGVQVLPFYHPAYEVLLYLPLTLFSFKTAYLVYALCNTLLLWVCYFVSPPGNSPFAGRRRYALFFLSFPPLLTIFFGQNSLLMLLGLCLVYTAIIQRKDFRSGLILGLLIFKLATIVPLALLLCMRRGRRFLAGFLVTSSASLALSALLVGTKGAKDFLHFLTGAMLAANPGIQSHVQVALQDMPNLSGLLYICGVARLNPHIALAANLAAALIVLAAGVHVQRRAISEAVAYSAAILCAVLISPHLYIYDLTALVLPMLLLAHRWLKYVAIVWFTLPALLYCFGFLNSFAFAVIIPLLLLAICVAEFRSEQAEPATLPSATPAYSCPD
jgi:hypothetical protein